ERVRLVDEEHPVDRTADHALGLDRGQPDVLADEPGAVDLDEMAALQQPHRAIHLRKQARDRRLAGARVAEEDEVLRRRHLRQAGLLAARLHAQERDECPHLLLHQLEPRQRIELLEELLQRPRRLLAAQRVEIELLPDLGAQLVAERLQGIEGIGHCLTVPITVRGMQGPMTPEELRRYADMIVRGCIAFRRGDSLIEMVSLGHRDLAIAVAEAAYRAGALAVDVQYEDGRAYAAKIANAPRKALGHQPAWRLAQWKAIGTEPVAIVQVIGEFELDAVANLSPERVAADTGGRNRYVARIRREAKLRGTICAWPTAEWAARVYPELDAAKGTRQLGKDILSFCRLG